MPTITVRLDDETDGRLKRQLARSGETLSEFVRAAVVKQLTANPAKEDPYEAWLRLSKDLVGSGETDLSTTYKARFREIVRAKHNR
jgi:Arc/MetJ-type ribon-helix-helix transcriptional regulator